MWLADATGVNAHRDLLRPVLAAALVLLVVGLPSGVALSATDIPQIDRPDASFQAEVRSFQAEVRSFQERQRTSKARGERPTPRPALLADIPHDLPITTRPGKGKVIGRMPGGSRYYGEPLTAWIQDRSSNGRYGKVAVPYSRSRATGWMRIAGLELSNTPFSVRVELSRHLITVIRLDKVIMRFPAATGAPGSPTPSGRYFVTDRVAITPGGSFGSYAFGLSGVQPNLPAGWSGGDQLAIHGTSAPSSIGTSASAGCLRVGERALDRLKPLLRLGTPVTIKP